MDEMWYDADQAKNAGRRVHRCSQEECREDATSIFILTGKAYCYPHWVAQPRPDYSFLDDD